MSEESKVKILLGVFSLLGVLAVGYWQYGKTQPNPPGEVIPYTGRVRDSQTNAPIPRAKVSIEEGQNLPQRQETDSDGLFHVKLSPDTTEVRIVVEASGYDSVERRVPVRRTGLEDVRLDPRPVTPTASPTPSPTATPTPARPTPTRLRPSRPTPTPTPTADDCTPRMILRGECQKG